MIVGCDPLLMLAGSAMVENANEYDVVGTLRGAPVEIVKAPLTGLPIPATAEWVLEGYIDGDNLRPRAPSGSTRATTPRRSISRSPSRRSRSRGSITATTRSFWPHRLGGPSTTTT